MKKFSLWIEGYSATGQDGTARYLGEIEGENFNDAVKAYVEKLSDGAKRFWSSNLKTGGWSYWGCDAFDNESAARRSFG